MVPLSDKHDIRHVKADDQSPQNHNPNDTRPVNGLLSSTSQLAVDQSEPKIEDNAEDASRDNGHLRTWRFYAILATLSFTGLLTTIEVTTIPNALPTIAAALGGGNSFMWIVGTYSLASVVTLPFYAQASNIFGRRWPFLGAVSVFILGSGLCGGSSSMRMLLASRTVQGLGGGGIGLLSETIIQDIVPLRERGKYMSVVLILPTLVTAVGPLLGGVIASRLTWRWVFYLDVPIGGAALVLLFVFLRLNYQRNQTWKARVRRVDVGGHVIFIPSVISVLFALTYGGTVYSWRSYHVIVPISLGFLGLFGWTAFEWTPKLAPEPSFPRRIVSNRTSTAAFIVTFLHSIIGSWTFYFLPIYFQAVKGQSPLHSGVNALPTYSGIITFAVIGGLLLSKIGRYKPLHIFSFIPITVAFGLFSTLDEDSNSAAFVCYQLLCSVGTGFLVSITLPAVQAPLDESEVATATGFWSFIRNFGTIWGVTIPTVVFNNECAKRAVAISDVKLAHMLSSGKASEMVTQKFLNSIHDQALRAEVITIFTQAMHKIWYVGLVFAGLGLIVALFEREVEMREILETQFGIEEKTGTKEKVAASVDIALSTAVAQPAGQPV